MKFEILPIVFLFICCSSAPQKNQIQTEMPEPDKHTYGVIADSAMVVTANAFATRVGIEILHQGGNAVDAAVAVQFALAVVYPNAGNIGGGGFMVYRNKNGEINSLDFREKAPSASSKNMFVDPKTGEVDRQKIEASHLASGVPGSVDGMWTAHQKYGSMKWEQLIQPAIDLAINGFTITARQATELNGNQAEIKKLNPGKSYFIKEKWAEGDTMKQIDLAQTFIRIQKKGRDGFYAGETADLIVKEMRSHNGIITHDDLENYHAVWRSPVSGTYKNYKVISMPPPSSGGVALIELLNAVEQFPLKDMGFHSVKSMHLIAEAEKFVYADRSEWLGDPDFFNVPVDSLINKAYAKRRMQNFSESKVTSATDINPAVIIGYESDETTHFSIVDQFGNAVAITTTLNDSYGSRIVVNGCGFILNNEMDDFSAKPGEPNLYGLIGGEANSIAPDKRMLSSMTPTIVLKDDELFMVVGSPGGSTIITSVFQTILNVIEFDMTMQESVNAGRFHNQWLPDEIMIERGKFPMDVIGNLRMMGYKITDKEAIGRVDAILINNKQLEGAADKRGDDTALGF